MRHIKGKYRFKANNGRDPVPYLLIMAYMDGAGVGVLEPTPGRASFTARFEMVGDEGDKIAALDLMVGRSCPPDVSWKRIKGRSAPIE